MLMKQPVIYCPALSGVGRYFQDASNSSDINFNSLDTISLSRNRWINKRQDVGASPVRFKFRHDAGVSPHNPSSLRLPSRSIDHVKPTIVHWRGQGERMRYDGPGIQILKGRTKEDKQWESLKITHATKLRPCGHDHKLFRISNSSFVTPNLSLEDPATWLQNKFRYHKCSPSRMFWPDTCTRPTHSPKPLSPRLLLSSSICSSNSFCRFTTNTNEAGRGSCCDPGTIPPC
ncbi:hypothetical protein V8F06_002461 [Rhypophila decipiens]